MIKTKKDLNQKMWFRTLKALYLLIFLVSIAGIVGGNYIPYELDVSSSFITCSDGMKIYIDDLRNDNNIKINENTLTFKDSDLASVDGVCLMKMKDPITGQSLEDWMKNK